MIMSKYSRDCVGQEPTKTNLKDRGCVIVIYLRLIVSLTA